MLQAIGHAVAQVAQALQAAFAMAAEAVGEVLEAIGYTLEQISQALHDVFGLAEDALKDVLVAIGFSEDAIDDLFEVLECLLFPPACFF